MAEGLYDVLAEWNRQLLGRGVDYGLLKQLMDEDGLMARYSRAFSVTAEHVCVLHAKRMLPYWAWVSYV